MRTLILSNCEAFKELPKDIGKLLKLNELNLTFCSNLKALPDSMFQLKELKRLDLFGCLKSGCLPDSIVTCHNSRHFNWRGATNWKIYQWSSGNFKAWWNYTYPIISSCGVYLIQLWTCHNARHFDYNGVTNWKIYQ